jgi:KDO2-lipid IV(A) lauroyltransferase
MTETRPALYRFWAPRHWPVWLALGLMRASLLLPYRWQLGAGLGLGSLLHRVLPGRRHVVRRNLEICFPELGSEARERLVREHFRSLGASLVEMSLAWWASDERLERLCRLEGIEHLERALAAGRGAILMTAHFTTLEISGRLLARHATLDAMYRPQKKAPFFDEVLRRGREKAARRTIAKDDVRTLVRSLRENVVVWYAPDQKYRRKNAALVTFFGEPAMTNTATSRLARLAGAPVLPYFSERLPDARGYVLRIEPPLEDFPTDDPVADTERLNRRIEAQIRRAPEQYFWVHRKFRGRPEPYVDPYSEPAEA